MKIVETIREMKEIIRDVRLKGATVGFVPTMGFLHEGHLTLMTEARIKTDFVVTSIFVNPLQFGVGEDYEEYPRDLSRDTELAAGVGVDIIFAPQVREMYPKGYSAFVEVEGLTDRLCGKSRPGHFRGVTTVVAKLFNIVQPDISFFGQKDAQQALVLQKMVEDLNMNLAIEVVPIVREKDGLAMSSRNAYLNPAERTAALVLSQSLKEAQNIIHEGETNPDKVLDAIREYINREPLAKVDYAEILTVPGLESISVIKGRLLIALAVYIGKTRLIDNIVVEV